MARYGPVARANATRDLSCGHCRAPRFEWVEFGTKYMAPEQGTYARPGRGAAGRLHASRHTLPALSMCLLLQSSGGGVFALTQSRSMLQQEWRTIDESSDNLP